MTSIEVTEEISNESVLSDDSSDDDWNTFCAKQRGTSIVGEKRLESTIGSKQARVQQIFFVNHKEKLYPEVTDKVDEKGATLNAVKRTVGGTLEMVRRQG